MSTPTSGNDLTTDTSHSKTTLKPQPVTSRSSTNSSTETLENISLEGDETDQTTLITTTNGILIEPSKIAKVGVKKSRSLLGRSITFLNRNEEKQSKLVKVHRYTIYDSEKEEFIEIVEEEWDGDRPPPRQSVTSQNKSTILVDKDLPSLPEPITKKKEGNNFKKFYEWAENEWYQHKKRILISLGVILLLLFIIILAAAGVFSKSNNVESSNNSLLSGTGEGAYYNLNGGVGACGKQNTNNDLVGGLNAAQYNSTICGKCLKITGPKGTVDITIVDKCPTNTTGNICLSMTAFKKISDDINSPTKISWGGC
ncbi:4918_t:CDS:2 [Scutellospora calospora]|uniref:4918_t:CDS:1 n=1 Tax=Scutellospora calospora TaxID=85575 RepID=A0ACA9LSB8_9GLOM|nr:4918_t:CDS:2 [Scutellospora calospora]